MKTNQTHRQRQSDLSRRINILEQQLQVLMANKLDYPDSSDVCRQLHISKRALAYLRESGELPFIKVGNKILFDPSDIRQYLDFRKTCKTVYHEPTVNHSRHDDISDHHPCRIHHQCPHHLNT